MARFSCIAISITQVALIFTLLLPVQQSNAQESFEKLQVAVKTLRDSAKSKDDFETLDQTIEKIVKSSDKKKTLNELSQNYDTSDPFQLFCSFVATRPIPSFLDTFDDQNVEEKEVLARNVCLRLSSDEKFRRHYMQFIKWANSRFVVTTDDDSENSIQRKFSDLQLFTRIGFDMRASRGPWDHRLLLAVLSDLYGFEDWHEKHSELEKNDAWGRDLRLKISNGKYRANGFRYELIGSQDDDVIDLRSMWDRPPLQVPATPFPIADPLIQQYIKACPAIERYLGRVK